jgi:hypothetical protein
MFVWGHLIASVVASASLWAMIISSHLAAIVMIR